MKSFKACLAALMMSTLSCMGTVNGQTTKTVTAVYDLQSVSTTSAGDSATVKLTSKDKHKFTIPAGTPITLNGSASTPRQVMTWVLQTGVVGDVELVVDAMKNNTVVSAAFRDKPANALPAASVRSEGFPRPMPAAPTKTVSPVATTQQSTTSSTTVTTWQTVQAAPVVTRTVVAAGSVPALTQTPTTVLRVAPLRSWWQSLPRLTTVTP